MNFRIGVMPGYVSYGAHPVVVNGWKAFDGARRKKNKVATHDFHSMMILMNLMMMS